MLAQLIDRDAMIADLALAFGCDPHLFRIMDQEALDRAWLCARTRWG